MSMDMLTSAGASFLRHGSYSGADSPPSTPRSKVPIIIGVGGASGSGKTSIAGRLNDALLEDETKLNIVSISMDSYYKGLPAGTDAANYNWDDPAALDMSLLQEHLVALHNGLDVVVPEYDFSRHARADAKSFKTIHSAETDVVLLDGIFVLAVAEVRARCDLTIFTIEDLDVCLARRLKRDISERGRSVESVLNQYLTFVKPCFTNIIQPSMMHADILVPRARENLMAIEMLAKEVQRRVSQEAARALAGIVHTPRQLTLGMSKLGSALAEAPL